MLGDKAVGVVDGLTEDTLDVDDLAEDGTIGTIEGFKVGLRDGTYFCEVADNLKEDSLKKAPRNESGSVYLIIHLLEWLMGDRRWLRCSWASR